MITQEELSQKGCALFFTEGVSLKSWDKAGILSREITFYNELSRYFAKFYFLTYGTEDDLQYRQRVAENIKIFPILRDLRKNGNNSLFQNIVRDVDFLRTHQVRGAQVALQCKKENDLPLVVRCGYIWSLHHRQESHNPFTNWWVTSMEKKIFRECDAILCTSKAACQHAIKFCGNLNKPVQWIPNYVDTNLFKPLAIKKKRKSLIFVGRLVRQKNILALLEAIEGVSCSLTLVGEGPLREMIFSFAQQKKISLEYHQKVPNEELPFLLNQHEIFVLPSLYEGMPKALLEAMSCGLAVIGSAIDGITDLIQDGLNGCLSSTHSMGLRQALLRLLENPTLREKYGKSAQKSAQEKFSLQQVVKQEIRFYKDILC